MERAEASVIRESLRAGFRLGIGKGWRIPNLGKYASDAALRQAAGRTNASINAYATGTAAAAADDIVRDAK